MNVETLTRIIMDKMADIGKWQRDFMNSFDAFVINHPWSAQF